MNLIQRVMSYFKPMGLRDDPMLSSEQRYQINAEWAAVAYIFVFMCIATLAFWVSPQTAVMRQFSEDLNTHIEPRHFAILAFIGALASITLLSEKLRNRWSTKFKQRLYSFSALPILAYTVPIGWVVLRTGGSLIGAVIYIMLFFAFTVIARATYRE